MLSLPYTVVSDAVCVRLTGELDHHTIGPLRADIDACIRRTGARCLVLDATDVPFMDSSVIGLILGRLELVRSRGGEVRVVGLSARNHRLLTLSGLSRTAGLYLSQARADVPSAKERSTR